MTCSFLMCLAKLIDNSNQAHSNGGSSMPKRVTAMFDVIRNLNGAESIGTNEYGVMYLTPPLDHYDAYDYLCGCTASRCVAA